MLGVRDEADLSFVKKVEKTWARDNVEPSVLQDFGVELIWKFVHEDNKNKHTIRLTRTFKLKWKLSCKGTLYRTTSLTPISEIPDYG